jgi:hypothetical protein
MAHCNVLVTHIFVREKQTLVQMTSKYPAAMPAVQEVEYDHQEYDISHQITK